MACMQKIKQPCCLSSWLELEAVAGAEMVCVSSWQRKASCCVQKKTCGRALRVGHLAIGVAWRKETGYAAWAWLEAGV